MRKDLPILRLLNWLKDHRTFVFLETARRNPSNRFSYIFVHPVKVIECYQIDGIRDAFAQLESYLNKGYYAAGFFSYEMGYSFENLYQAKRNYKFPLIWLGIFKSPIVFDHRRNRFSPVIANPSLSLRTGSVKQSDKVVASVSEAISMRSPRPDKSGLATLRGLPRSFYSLAMTSGGAYQIKNLRLNVSQKDYLNSINKIKEFIRAGETYQVNYTMKYKFDFKGSPYQLYHTLRSNQSVSYSAFIKTEDFKVLSFSPELFFRKKEDEIWVKPMKGTMERGRNTKEDRINKNKLKFDIKNNAENIMIVDLLRNDLGVVAQVGSVNVPNIFTVEKYETLFQMTSTIKSVLRKNLSLYKLFSAIFPSGSVTGAPKIRTMQIIKELEKEPRKVYTGAIGFFTPEKKAVFNVAIRTLFLEGERGEMGIGSGIVQDSDGISEYEECKLKADFLVNPRPEFQLIETMLWSKKTGFFLLKEHLRRLKDSSLYFEFHYNQKHLRALLSELKKQFNAETLYKVRLLLYKDGSISLTHQKLTGVINSAKLATISKFRTSSKALFLRHKTTNRKLYDEEYRKYRKSGYYDVLFRNEKAEITEGAISNIFIKSGKFYYTPPLACGLLNGVYRRYLLNKRPNIKEKVLTLKELKNADKIYLVNSVRGINKIDLVRNTE